MFQEYFWGGLIMIKKDDFNKMDISEQVKFFNDLLASNDSNSVSSICRSLNLPRTTFGDRLKRNNYAYDKNNRYIDRKNGFHSSGAKQAESKKTLNLEEFEIIDNSPKIEIIQEYQKVFSILQHNAQDILELISLKDEIKQFVKSYKVHNIDSELNINYSEFKGNNATRRSIIVYDNILKDFDTFCEIHNHLKKQDIVSQAFLEFLNKYDKN